MLGTDVTPLLAHYDERYADAPINPRRVFEAELGSGGAIRATRGGPNWSVLIAAVMALVLAWSVARLITDSPVELRHIDLLTRPRHRPERRYQAFRPGLLQALVARRPTCVSGEHNRQTRATFSHPPQHHLREMRVVFWRR